MNTVNIRLIRINLNNGRVTNREGVPPKNSKQQRNAYMKFSIGISKGLVKAAKGVIKNTDIRAGVSINIKNGLDKKND